MSFQQNFPITRMRRLRYAPGIRRMLKVNSVEPSNLILPLFVKAEGGSDKSIATMPPHKQLTIESLVKEVEHAKKLGIGGVILFGIPDEKDPLGKDSYSQDGIIQKALRATKEVSGDMLMMTDVCFCEYTDHGHCGKLVERDGVKDVDNDSTLDLLKKQAVSHCDAGADLVAPSGMMDGMIGAMRQGLDEKGYNHIPIMSYAAKYASAYYGPFRDAAESTPQFGDRRTYQMDYCADASQALREVELDINEGADIVMVKPALAYLDIIRSISDNFPGVPVAAYNVSGEYSMIKAAAQNGWVDEGQIVLETMVAIKRAGANIILTYFAKDIAESF